MIDKSVVNKYAKTLSILMSEEKNPEKVFEDFFSIANALSGEEKSVKFFLNPSVSKKVKVEKLQSFLDKVEIGEKYKKFLTKVILNNRFKILYYLMPATKRFLYEALGIVEVNLTVPKPISKQIEKKFVDVFEKKSGKKVKLNVSVDKEIIGGAVAKMGSLLIDGSVKTKILKIKEKLTGEL